MNLQTALTPEKDYIPVARQMIFESDKAALREVVDSGLYAEGKQCDLFAKSVENYIGCGRAMLTNSGSSALLAALTALKETQPAHRKYVVTSALNFPTTVSAIYQAGFIPWYIDCHPETLQVDIAEVIKLCWHVDVAGAVLAHTLGFPFDACYLARSSYEDKFVVEDACDAWGAELFVSNFTSWKKVGSFGTMSTFSGYPAHHINMGGEGGIVCCNDPKYEKILRSVINWGRDCVCPPGRDNVCGKRFQTEEPGMPPGYDHKYIFRRLGYNLKATEFQGALGNQQLKHLDWFVQERKKNYVELEMNLCGIGDLSILPKPLLPGYSPFGVPIRSEYASKLIPFLEKNKIGTRRIFGGNLLRQPAFKDLPHAGEKEMPGADDLMYNAFFIGCWPGWTSELSEYVCTTMRKFFATEI